MNSGTRAKVVTPGGDFKEFAIEAGVIQAGVINGDAVASYLFVITLDYSLRQAISGHE